MSYTLGQAAKVTGKSKMTIQRAIKSGKISAIRKEDNSYNIDPAELHRVFPPVSESDTQDRNELQTDTPSDTRLLRREIEIRDEKISALGAEREQERRTLKTTIEDLREDRDRWRAQAEQATRLLTDQREPGTTPTPARITGRLPVLAVLLLVALGLLVFAYWPVLADIMSR